MNRRKPWFMLTAMIAVASAALGNVPTRPAVQQEVDVRFEPIAVYIDPNGRELGAYQCEIVIRGAKLVGVEGGELDAFAKPPYYDPEALTGDRIIIGAFSVSDDLPTMRTRVARLHVMMPAGATMKIETRVQAAADANGDEIKIGASAFTESIEADK